MMDLPLTSAIDARRAGLRRMKTLASGLLVIAAVICLGTSLAQTSNFWLGLARAGAEAAIVGGLADWFAITALFRRPLGLPIPHTALIPTRKSDIGRSLGAFVSSEFLDPELLVQRLKRENRALALAHWLEMPTVATFVAGRIAVAIPAVLSSVKDVEIQQFLARVARAGLRRVDWAAVLDSVMDALVRSDKPMMLVDVIIDIFKESLHTWRDPVIQRVGERTGRFFPSYIDRKIAQAILDGLASWLDAIATPDSSERARVKKWLEDKIREWRRSPHYPALGVDVQRVILQHPVFIRTIEVIWEEIRDDLSADSSVASSQVVAVSEDVIKTIGRLVRESSALQDHLNSGIEHLLIGTISPWRIEIGNYIAEVVAAWDTDKMVDVIELQVGKDLQFVRMNGTVVGAAIGCSLFLLNAAVPSAMSILKDVRLIF